MHVSHLSLRDFRSYSYVDVPLEPGVTAFVGRNGQGKTNLVEAIDYLSRLSSHRVASDAPLIRAGAETAIVRAAVVRDGRTATLEVELVPGKANRARINRSPLPRARDLVGILRTVVFSPEDLALVKGDPSERRRFLDDLLVLRTPRLAGVRADYDRILKQRNSLLKSARRPGGGHGDIAATLQIWNDQLARIGGELVAERLQLVHDLAPYVAKTYVAVARGATQNDARIGYHSGADAVAALIAADPTPPTAALSAALTTELAARARDEQERGLTLVGPQRDDMTCILGSADGHRLPVKGYASHGESWSFALALKLAAYDLLRADGDDPILILDDVFAELDSERRTQLAELVAGAEQVLVTAAVGADVPAELRGVTHRVGGGEVTRD